MTIATPTATGTHTGEVAPPDPRTTLITGLLYLALAITGMVGFLGIRPQLLNLDPGVTTANLVAHEGLARLGIAVELGAVLVQALVALWFFKLFRGVDTFAAGALAAFGAINAVAIMGSAALLATGLDVALTPIGQDASQLMYLISGNLWGVGNLFFGLWLIPMGYLVLRSGWTTHVLGWFLIMGGAGYVASAFLGFVAPGLLADLLVIPATIGELWMVGWLLVRGLRRG